jgi:hypothetical protein
VAEQRKSKRFELRLPVQLIRVGAYRVSQQGETRNVSSGGVYFTATETPVEVGQLVEYLIGLPTGSHFGEIKLRCVGKVVRLEPDQNALAVTLERYEFVRGQHAA